MDDRDFYQKEVLQAEFDAGMQAAKTHFDDLIDASDLADFQGDNIDEYIVGNESDPIAYSQGVVDFDDFGIWKNNIKVDAYVWAGRKHKFKLSDDRTGRIMRFFRRVGRRSRVFREKKIIQGILEGTGGTVTGFDGQPMFSTTHTWTPSDQDSYIVDPSVGTQSNIVSAPSGTTKDNIITDWYQADALRQTWLNEKAQEFDPGESRPVIVWSSKNATLNKNMRLVFGGPDAGATDSSDRPLMGAADLRPSPWLTNNNKWYILYSPVQDESDLGEWQQPEGGGGLDGPFRLINRMDPSEIIEQEDFFTGDIMWKIESRFGYGIGYWWGGVKIDN